MAILDYYKDKNLDSVWVEKFQSTAENQFGKFFNLINVNFRNVKSYYSQLIFFKGKDGLKRSEMGIYSTTKQTIVKQKIQPLECAGFITEDDEKRIYITNKGKLAISIYESDNFNDREKWLIMYMLLLDFNFKGNELDLIKSVLEFSSEMKKYDMSASTLMKHLQSVLFVTDKQILFRKDIFWLISFYKDEKFIKLYLSSTKEEKEELASYVITCSKDDKTKDCIAHKYKSGGQYNPSMFNDDVNIILFTLILLALQDKDYYNFIKIVAKIYPTINCDKICKFIKENDTIFDICYSNSMKKINDLLEMKD